MPAEDEIPTLDEDFSCIHGCPNRRVRTKAGRHTALGSAENHKRTTREIHTSLNMAQKPVAAAAARRGTIRPQAAIADTRGSCRLDPDEPGNEPGEHRAG